MANYKFLGNHIVLTNESNETIYDENDQMIILAMVVECKGKHTGKYTAINRTGLSQVEVWDALTIAEDKPTTKFTSLLFAEKYAEMIAQNMLNELCALEAFADAANAALHLDIAAEVAEQDAAQAASEAIAENDGIDFVQVYIDGKPNKDASIGVMHAASGKYIQYFLRDDLAVNTVTKLNGDLLYLEEVILDTCFAHDNGEWEFWANPAHPDEKSLLMIYLCTTPVKARKKPEYPQENDYLEYADGGDGYTSENIILDF